MWNYFDDDDYDDEEFDCGAVDDKRLCLDVGSEHCSIFCPFHSVVFAQDVDELPDPPEDEQLPPPVISNSDDMDDIPF